MNSASHGQVSLSPALSLSLLLSIPPSVSGVRCLSHTQFNLHLKSKDKDYKELYRYISIQ